MYNIGDYVVHPLYGAGKISGKQEKEVLNVKQEYYVIDLFEKTDVVMLPVDSIGESGVREMCSKEKAEEIIAFLSSGTEVGNDNWNQRYRDNFERIKSGDIDELAHVVSELNNRDKDKGLSAREKKMLTNARSILFSELVVAAGMNRAQLEEILKKV